jgi:hypothetical protein
MNAPNTNRPPRAAGSVMDAVTEMLRAAAADDEPAPPPPGSIEEAPIERLFEEAMEWWSDLRSNLGGYVTVDSIAAQVRGLASGRIKAPPILTFPASPDGKSGEAKLDLRKVKPDRLLRMIDPMRVEFALFVLEDIEELGIRLNALHARLSGPAGAPEPQGQPHEQPGPV